MSTDIDSRLRIETENLRLQAECMASRQTNLALVGECERLRELLEAERARWAWLEANDVDVTREPDDDEDCREWGLVVWGLEAQGFAGRTYYGDTLAETIDAARAGLKAETTTPTGETPR